MPSSPIDMVQDDESVPPAVPVAAARRRRAVITGALTVAAILIVATVWFDRAQTPAVPGAAETGPALTGPALTGPVETGPVETAPPPDLASAAPDVMEERTCSNGARSRLELTDTGDRIKVRFKVYQSPVGHEWRIHFRYKSHAFTGTAHGHVFFRGTRVASDSGVFVVQLSRPDWDREGDMSPDGIGGEAVDRQTGQVCKANAWYR